MTNYSCLIFRVITHSCLRRQLLNTVLIRNSKCLGNFCLLSYSASTLLKQQGIFSKLLESEFHLNHKFYSTKTDYQKFRNKTVLLYVSAAAILVGGLSYAAVPLYRIYCQATGKGGQAFADGSGSSKVEDMKRVSNRVITVNFNADTTSSMQWNFKPMQKSIKVVPGETALAFYVAKNPTDSPVDGIATYNVLPFEAGQYFNKIQCFCFEEQRLNPHEEVDMPVFFYLDPEFAEDPKMENVNDITLSYTFFDAKNFTLPF